MADRIRCDRAVTVDHRPEDVQELARGMHKRPGDCPREGLHRRALADYRARHLEQLGMYAGRARTTNTTTIFRVISLSWLPAALPALGALVKALSGLLNSNVEHRAERRVRRHAELFASLPEQAERTELIRLINLELDAIAERNERLLYRRVDVGNLAAIIAVLVVGTGLVVLLWQADSWDWMPSWAVVIARIIAVLVGIFAFVLVTVGGLSSFWTDTRQREGSDSPATNGAVETEVDHQVLDADQAMKRHDLSELSKTPHSAVDRG